MLTSKLKMSFHIIPALFLTQLCCQLSVHAQYREATIKQLLHTPKTYVVYKAQEKINIDGKPDELAWQHAPWTTAFLDIEGTTRPDPLFDTRVKMLWDEHFLYIYAQLEEPHIWATLDKHDDIIYHNNDFEIFIQNLEYGSAYYEIEINALGTIFDLYMPMPYRSGGRALISWDLKGLQSAVHIAGSLNDPSDIDRYWAVEMAIPFAGISHFGRRATPRPDDLWRINFSRVQWQHEISNGKYHRKTDNNGKTMPEYNWVWSPQGIIDMHYPERWGYIRFEENVPQAADINTFDIGPRELVKQKAWFIHYLQTRHRRLHGRYTSTAQDLSKLYGEWEHELAGFKLELTAGNDWYVAKIYAQNDDICFSINQYGQLSPSSLDDNKESN